MLPEAIAEEKRTRERLAGSQAKKKVEEIVNNWVQT